jgi:hypothetical protein
VQQDLLGRRGQCDDAADDEDVETGADVRGEVRSGPTRERVSAVVTEAPTGADAAVATRKMARTALALPCTALAAQVNVDQTDQSTRNSSAPSAAPAHLGSWTRCHTSQESAKTNARSKSSTGSEVKSAVESGTTRPLAGPT